MKIVLENNYVPPVEIKNGYKVLCSKCGSVYLIEKSDFEVDHYCRIFSRCPCCGSNSYLDSILTKASWKVQDNKFIEEVKNEN